eukprot:362360-Chlamydomonas_euryale.AAC.10
MARASAGTAAHTAATTRRGVGDAAGGGGASGEAAARDVARGRRFGSLADAAAGGPAGVAGGTSGVDVVGGAMGGRSALAGIGGGGALRCLTRLSLYSFSGGYEGLLDAATRLPHLAHLDVFHCIVRRVCLCSRMRPQRLRGRAGGPGWGRAGVDQRFCLRMFFALCGTLEK